MSHRDPREEMVDYIPSLRAFARALTQNHAAADDLVQDAIVKAWANIEKYKVGTNLQAWMFTILRNTHYSNLRKHRREVEDVDGNHAAKLAEKAPQDSAMAFNDFKTAFMQLPVDQREALVLVGASGYSYEEAAEMCECAVGTMKSRVNRARTKLADLMQLEEGEDVITTEGTALASLGGTAVA
jgi:RNA polymerase sigma-70 factor (ECF subfamily)